MEAAVKELLDWMASFGAEPEGGVTRLLYSEAWKAGQQALAEKMRQTGLHAYFDDAGNLFGRLQGTEKPERVIMTGSHIDTVRYGGMYDGAYGIAAGFIAVQRLMRTYGPPKVTIEVASFCEEEGSRFPLAYWGSGNITGTWSMDLVPDVHDADHVAFRDAMKEAGFGPNSHKPCRRSDIDAFIELHIEQGQVLESENKQIGIVQGIVGQRRFMIEVDGEANHAGTTPMKLRLDALAGAAEMLVYVEQAARMQGEPLVATIGKLESLPNTANVIPGKVRFTLDIRHSQEEVLEVFCGRVIAAFKDIAERRLLQFKWSTWVEEKPALMHAGLTEKIRRLCVQQGLQHRFLFSGAGHDAQLFRSICPTAMIFVPSHKGISHSPHEYTEPADLEAGVQVLTELLYILAYEGGQP